MLKLSSVRFSSASVLVEAHKSISFVPQLHHINRCGDYAHTESPITGGKLAAIKSVCRVRTEATIFGWRLRALWRGGSAVGARAQRNLPPRALSTLRFGHMLFVRPRARRCCSVLERGCSGKLASCGCLGAGEPRRRRVVRVPCTVGKLRRVKSVCRGC